MLRKLAHHNKSALREVLMRTWWCGRDKVFVTSIIRRRNVRPPKTTRAAKFNFPTRLCNSRFVIDRLSKVSLNNCRSSHSLLSGKHPLLFLLVLRFAGVLSFFKPTRKGKKSKQGFKITLWCSWIRNLPSKKQRTRRLCWSFLLVRIKADKKGRYPYYPSCSR